MTQSAILMRKGKRLVELRYPETEWCLIDSEDLDERGDELHLKFRELCREIKERFKDRFSDEIVIEPLIIRVIDKKWQSVLTGEMDKEHRDTLIQEMEEKIQTLKDTEETLNRLLAEYNKNESTT